MREADIQKEIVTWAQKNGIWVVKYPGGIFGTTGTPDLILCVKGRFLALEVKKPGKPPKKIQEYRQNEIRKSSGISEIVVSLEEAVKVIEGVG